MTLDVDVVRGRCTEIAEAVERLQRIRGGGRNAGDRRAAVTAAPDRSLRVPARVSTVDLPGR